MSDSTKTQEKPRADDPQRDQLLDHNYDGIQEYDNPMPRWWVLLFWGSFLFALGYFFHYQLSPNGRGAHDIYEAEMKVAAAEAEKRALAEQVTEESLQEIMKQEPMVLSGQAVFQQRCVTCHLEQGQGKIGPNLTDDFWIHGGALMDVYDVVNNGVVEKGMQAWGKTLKPIELRQVVAYVGTLRGKNVPGKAPQGERHVPEAKDSPSPNGEADEKPTGKDEPTQTGETPKEDAQKKTGGEQTDREKKAGVVEKGDGASESDQ